MLLNNIRFLLICTFALLFTAACQKAKDLDVEPAAVQLSAPTEGAAITAVTDSQQLAIELKGNVNANDVRVALNGNDITPDLRVTSMRLFALLKDISQHVQRGNNYVDVNVLNTSINKTFEFFLDDQAPVIQVTTINGGLVRPGPGYSMVVEGNVIDVSPIESLKFNTATGIKTATIIGQPPNQTFKVSLTYPERSDPSYTPGNPLNPYDQFNPDIHWITNQADFTYTIVDSRGQKTVGQWVAPESRFNNAAEMLVSRFAFTPVKTLLNSLGSEVVEALDDMKIASRADDELKRAWPSGNFTYPEAEPTPSGVNPNNQLTPGVSVIDYSTCDTGVNNYCPSRVNTFSFVSNLPANAQAYLVPIDSLGGPGYCASQVFDTEKVDTCAVYITKVDISAPSFGFDWDKQADQPKLDVKLRFNRIVASAQIVGLKSDAFTTPGDLSGSYTYQGALKTNIKFDGLELTTAFKVRAGNVYQPNLNQFVPNIKTPDVNDVDNDGNKSELINDVGRVIELGLEDANGTPLQISYTVGFFDTELSVANYFVSQIQAAINNPTTPFDAFVTNKSGSFTVQSPNALEVTLLDNISIDKNAKLLRFERIPGVESRLDNIVQNILDLDRPIIYGTTCNVCDVKAGPFDVSVKDIEWLYNYNFIKDGGESIGSMIMKNIEQGLDEFAGPLLNNGVAGMEKALNDFAFKNDLFPPNALPTAPGTRSIQFDVSATTAKLEASGNPATPPSGRFVFDGKIKTNNLDTTKPAAIGFNYEKQYGFDDWMFYSKLFHSKTPNDFSVALSANILNQYMVSAYETGLYDEYSIDFSGAEFNGSELTGVASDQFALTVELVQAPSIKLVPFQKQISYGGCVEFQGMGNCGSGGYNKIVQKEIPAQVAIHIPGVKVFVENTTSGQPVLEVTADIQLGALVENNAFKPKVEFSKVRVTNIAPPPAPLPFGLTMDSRFERARVGAILQVLFNNLGAKSNNLLQVPARIAKASDFIDTNSATFDLITNNVLPLEIGFKLSVLKIDKGGDYLTAAGNFVTKKVPLCSDVPTDEGYLTALCIKKQ